MCGLVANEIVEPRGGKKATENCVTVNTDHAAFWLATTYISNVNGRSLGTLARTGGLHALFEKDFEKDFGKGLGSRATAIYQTLDPKVWYQLHGSMYANPMLSSMGIELNFSGSSMKEKYDYIQNHVKRWSAAELEMHNLERGLCGNICYSPQQWRQTEMGKHLARHPLLNYPLEDHSRLTDPIHLPQVPGDKRPLAGIKVIEMVRIIAGLTVGLTLASFGADLIRIQSSQLSDLNVRFPLSLLDLAPSNLTTT